MITHVRQAYSILPASISTRRLLPVFMFILVSSWLEALGVGIIFPLVKVIADPASIQTMGMLTTINQALGEPSQSMFLTLLTLAVFAVFASKNAFYIFMMNFNLKVVKESEAGLCEELLLGYLKGPWSNHLGRNSGNLLHSILIAPRQVHVGVIWPSLEVSVEILTLIMIGALLFVTDPVMTLVAIVFVALAMAVFLRSIPPRMSVLGRETVRIGKSSTVAIQQALGGAKESKVLRRELFFWKVFSKEARDRAVVERRQKLLQSLSRPVAETVLMGSMLAAILLVLSIDRSGTDVIATLSLFAVAAIRLLTSFNRLAVGIASIRNSLPMLDEIYDDVMSYRKLAPEAEPEPNGPAPRFERELVLQDIKFRYPERDQYVLNGVSLSIKRGQSVAFVGSSGAGKTTLVDIILGLLSPDGGKILIDDADVTSQQAWRRGLFGYVPQSIYLLDDTLRANIAFGLPGQEVDDAALAEAVEMARIGDLVNRLPQGLDTLVGEGGAKISGGERQRLGIARALYHKPDFIVFDEATSALDNVTEREFSDALLKMRGRQTVIFIAHRLSTIENCDKVFFIDAGEIVGEGTYSELMETCEPFLTMAETKRELRTADV